MLSIYKILSGKITTFLLTKTIAQGHLGEGIEANLAGILQLPPRDP